MTLLRHYKCSNDKIQFWR